MSDTPFNLDAYLARIDYTGPREASLGTLKALHAAHPRAIAFENLDPFLGRQVELDLATVQGKLVGGRRGGYCFEHNLVLLNALRALGFAVTPLAARVTMGRADDYVGPRSHMLLGVRLGSEDYIADVGFGGLTQTAPLLFDVGLEQATPHEPFRITRSDEDFRMQANVGDAWRTLYRFDLQRQLEVDYVAANYFASTSPASHFVTSLTAARAVPGLRYALRNARLTIHHTGGSSEQRQLGSAAEIARAFEDLFEVEVPDAAAFEKAVRDKKILEN